MVEWGGHHGGWGGFGPPSYIVKKCPANIAAISTTKLETWVPISLSYDDEYPPFLGGI
jgi:hypothetical protein